MPLFLSSSLIVRTLLEPVKYDICILHYHRPGFKHFFHYRDQRQYLFLCIDEFDDDWLAWGYCHARVNCSAFRATKTIPLSAVENH